MVDTRKVLIEAKPENGGRLTVLAGAGEDEHHLQLSPLKPNELYGLANELCDRGCEVELRETDVEAAPAALGPHAVLIELGFEAPYPAYDETIALAQSATRWDGTLKPRA